MLFLYIIISLYHSFPFLEWWLPSIYTLYMNEWKNEWKTTIHQFKEVVYDGQPNACFIIKPKFLMGGRRLFDLQVYIHGWCCSVKAQWLTVTDWSLSGMYAWPQNNATKREHGSCHMFWQMTESQFQASVSIRPSPVSTIEVLKKVNLSSMWSLPQFPQNPN